MRSGIRAFTSVSSALGHRADALGALLAQHRDAVLVDDQVRVVRVPGIDFRRRGLQPPAQSRGEARGGVRQAGLLAQLRQLRPALLPVGQRIQPVGKGVRAGDGDIAGPQVLGQVGEHQRLEAPPVQHPWPAPVPYGPLPVL
ncbi:hypothetical protein ACFYRG_36090 [Streptomyces mirabilis]|uniref:hypothetical protein n=1 Tax=Streptomyces mirabilis TaxID=68239 RepID=UPI00367A4D3E